MQISRSDVETGWVQTPGQGREGAAEVPGDTPGCCLRTGDIPDRHVLTHTTFEPLLFM